jgi:hypothetical protein
MRIVIFRRSLLRTSQSWLRESRLLWALWTLAGGWGLSELARVREGWRPWSQYLGLFEQVSRQLSTWGICAGMAYVKASGSCRSSE